MINLKKYTDKNMNKFIKPIAPGNKEGSPYTFVNPENLIPDLNSIADDRLRRAAEESSRLGIDRAHFWNMLVSYMPKSGFDYKHEVVHIIDIGCGVCKEAPVLNAYFGRKPFGSFSENVYITGIDIDDQSINQIIYRFSDQKNT